MEIDITIEKEMLNHILDMLETQYTRQNERGKDDTIRHVVRKLTTLIKWLDQKSKIQEPLTANQEDEYTEY